MIAKEIINRVFVRGLAVAVVTLMLSACGSGIEGTYSGSGSMAAGFMNISLQATFDSDTVIVKARTSAMGQSAGQTETEHEYELDGNKIKVKNMQGATQVWTVNDDGSITVQMPGASGIKLTRTSDAKAEISTGKHEAVAKAEGFGFSFSKFIAKITSSGLEGTYSGNIQKNGASTQMQIAFHQDNKVTLKLKTSMRGRTIINKEEEGEYELDGNKLKVTDAKGATEILTLKDDGSMTMTLGDETIILVRTNDTKADSSSGKRDAVAEAKDSGFSFSRFFAGIFGSGIEGTYSRTRGKLIEKLRFESGGTVLYKKNGGWQAPNRWGNEIELQYERDGNKVVVSQKPPLTIDKNGNLEGFDGTYIRMSGVQLKASTEGSDVADEDSGFSLSKFIARIFAPDVEGTYIFTAPKTSVKFAGVMKLELDSGKAILSMNQGDGHIIKETGTYVVDEKKVKIKGARGKTDIFILDDDGALMPPPGFTAGPRFVREG